MNPLLRLTYQTMLRLHPADFRAEFGDEMLWIFDEESHHGHVLSLLWDGLRSIALQHLRPRLQQPEAAGPIYIEIDSSLPSERFAQTTLVTICGILSISLFTSMVVPKVSDPIRSLLFTKISLFAPAPETHAHIKP